MQQNNRVEFENDYLTLKFSIYDKKYNLYAIKCRDRVHFELFKVFVSKSIIDGFSHEGIDSFSPREYLSLSWNDTLTEIRAYGIEFEILFAKFLLETHLDLPQDYLQMRLEEDQRLTETAHLIPFLNKEAHKGERVVNLADAIKIEISESLITRMNRFIPTEYKKVVSLFVQDRRTSPSTGFFARLPVDCLFEISKHYLVHDESHTEGRAILTNALNSPSQASNFFSYVENYIGLTDIGTCVKIEADKTFINWFEYFPLQITYKFGNCEIHKLTDCQIAINTGEGSCGVQIHSLEDGFWVGNNRAADRLPEEELRRGNLLHFLSIIQKIIMYVNDKTNLKLISAVQNNNLEGVQNALVEGADPNIHLFIVEQAKNVYPTLLHYLCLFSGYENKNMRRIILELIYWGADTTIADNHKRIAKNFASTHIEQARKVLEIVNKSIVNANLKHCYFRFQMDDVYKEFILFLMENYIESGSWVSPVAHKEKASIACCSELPAGPKCRPEVYTAHSNGIQVGCYLDIRANIKNYHQEIGSNEVFFGLLDFMLDEDIKLNTALNAFAATHQSPITEHLIAKAKWTKEGMESLHKGVHSPRLEVQSTGQDESIFHKLRTIFK